MNNLYIFCLLLTLIYSSCWLMKKIPETLIKDYMADQEELKTYQLPELKQYQKYTAIVTLCILYSLIYIYIKPDNTVKFILMIIFCSATVTMATIDWRARLLTDNTVYPLLWLGLVANTFGVFCNTNQAIFGAIIAYFIFWLPQKLIFLITKKESLGHGDMKMAAALGAWFGVNQISPLFMTIIITGIPISLMFYFATKHVEAKDKTTPYGIALALGSWIYYGIYQL